MRYSPTPEANLPTNPPQPDTSATPDEPAATPANPAEDVVALSARFAALGGSTVTVEDIVAALREVREAGGA